MRTLAGSCLVSLLLSAACGGASAPTEAAAPTRSEAAVPAADHPARELADSQVYDESGQARACEPPKASCAPAPRPVEFLDHCRLAGYQVRKCGCEELCGGKVTSSKQAYDAQGKAKDCAPAKNDCTTPETSAAFQDACNEHGHKLVVCGCEWLCKGPPR